jgi:hypothetical protein
MLPNQLVTRLNSMAFTPGVLNWGQRCPTSNRAILMVLAQIT